MGELHPVHFGPDQVIVDLLGDRPVGHIERRQTLLLRAQLLVDASHRCRRIVGNAVDETRFIELAKLLEQGYQVVVAAATWGSGGGSRPDLFGLLRSTAGDEEWHEDNYGG